MKKVILISLIFFSTLQVQAFEDYIITTKGKLTDISIEDNTVVDVYPLITIMNDKNTLMVSPLKVGKTRFCVLKNKKEKVMFNIEITEDKTTISNQSGFEVLSLDTMNYEFRLDPPPTFAEDK